MASWFWKQIAETEWMRKVIGGDVTEQLRDQYRQQFKTVDEKQIYSGQNLLAQIIRQKKPTYSGIQSFLTYLGSSGVGKYLLNPVTYWTYQTISKIMDPNQRQSVWNYALATSAWLGQGLGIRSIEKLAQQTSPEQYAKYETFKGSLHYLFPLSMKYQQLYFQDLKASLKLMGEQIVNRSFAGFLVGLKGFGASLFNLTVGSYIKQAQLLTEEDLMRLNASELQVGLNAIVSLKHTGETQLAGVLERTYRDVLYNPLVAARSGRTKSLEAQYQRLIRHLETAPEDDRFVKEFIEDLNKRLSRITYKKSQHYRPVTMADIALGKVKASDIYGKFVASQVVEKDIDLFDERIRHITELLIKRGLRPDLPIGYGIYTMVSEADVLQPGKLFVNPPGYIKLLQHMSVLASSMKVPYLGFNPLSVFQPQFFLNIALRPTLQQHEQNKLVPTQQGFMRVFDLAKESLATKYKPWVKSQVKRFLDVTLFREQSVFRTLAQAQGAKQDEIEQVIEAMQDLKQQDKVKQFLQKYGTAMANYVVVSSAKSPQDAAQQAQKMFSDWIHDISFAARMYRQLEEDRQVTGRTIYSLLRMLGTQDHKLQRFHLASIAGQQQTLQDVADVAHRANYVVGQINKKASEQTVIYSGRTPFLVIGNKMYLAENVVLSGHNIPRAGLSATLMEVYQKETRTIKRAKGVRFRYPARVNVPFYQDYNVGAPFWEEMWENITQPWQYEKNIEQLQGLAFAQNRLGLILGLERSVEARKIKPYWVREFFTRFASFQTPGEQQAQTDQLENMVRMIDEYMSIYSQQKFQAAKPGPEKQFWGIIANVLEPGIEEVKLFSDITYQAKQRPIAHLLTQIISQPAQARSVETLLGFAQYVYQVTNRAQKTLETILGDVSLEAIQRQFPNVALSAQNKAVIQEMADLFQKNLGQIQSALSSSELRKFMEEFLKENPAFKLDDEMLAKLSDQFLAQLINKTNLADIVQYKQLPLKNLANATGQTIYDYLNSILKPFDVSNAYSNVRELADKKLYNWYVQKLQNVLGINFVDYIGRRMFGQAPTLEDVSQYIQRGEQIPPSMFVPFGSVIKKIPYEFPIQENKYLFMQTFEDVRGFKDLWKMLTADAAKGVEGLKAINPLGLYLHYVFARTSGLLEEIGLGRPNVFLQTTWWKEFGGVLEKVGWIAMFVGALGVIDQLLTESTAGLINPNRALWEVGSSVYTGLVQFQNVTGLGPAFRHLKENYGGLLPLALGAYGGIVGGLRSFIFFQSVGTLLEHTPTTREQALQVEGVTNVPVYSARGWEYGREPYWGGKIKEWRPSLFYLQRKEWQYTPLLFGSKLEYQMFQQPFPTPLNLMGLLPTFSDHYDKKLLMYRPYERTGQQPGALLLGQLWPPVLGTGTNLQWNYAMAVLRLTRPTESLVDEYVQGLRRYELSFMGGEPTTEAIHAYEILSITNSRMLAVRDQIGYNNENVAALYASLKESQINAYNEILKQYEYSAYRVSDLASWLQDYLGFFGFQVGSMFGEGSSQAQKLTIQTSDYYRSPERLFYQMRLGNIFGLTEFYRRINQSERWQQLQIHTIPNVYMIQNFPWLPDRFLRGDQYQQIPFGEVRLPGPGYEYIRGTVDQYGPVDIFRILANVQPYSSQARVQHAIAKRVQERAPEAIRYVIERAEYEMEQQIKGFPVEEYPFTRKLEPLSVELKEYLGEGRFTTETGEVIELRGFTTDLDRIAMQIFENKFVSIEEAYAMAAEKVSVLEQQLKGLENTRVTVYVPADIGLRYRYYGEEDLRLQAVLPALEIPRYAESEETWLDVRQTRGTNVFKILWENLSHLSGFLGEKFIARRSQYQEFARYYAYGQYRALWQRPISDILLPTLFTTWGDNPFWQQVRGQFTMALQSPEAQMTQPLQIQGMTASFIGQLVTPRTLILPSNKKIYELEEETMYIRHLGGERMFYEYERLPSMSQMVQSLPQEHRTIFEQLQNQPRRDWNKILAIQPSYMKQMLREIYEAKSQVAVGYEDFYIEEDQREEFEEQFASQRERVSLFAIQAQPQIDPEHYRQLIQLRSKANLQSMQIYQNQLQSQFVSLERVNSKIGRSRFDNSVYYIREIQSLRGV